MTATAKPEPTTESGHVESIFVQFEDLDSMGLLHNARYAFVLERALTAFWDSNGYSFRNGVMGHPDTSVGVAEFSISYRMPVRGTGPVDVHFWIDRLGSTSVTYGFRVLSEDGNTVHAQGSRVHIRLDSQTLRPTPWADDTRAIYENLLLK